MAVERKLSSENSVPMNRDKKKLLRWAHVSSVEVNSALDGLLENTVVALPESCVQASGIQPNISDKNKPKKLVRTDAITKPIAIRHAPQFIRCPTDTAPSHGPHYLSLQWLGRLRYLRYLLTASLLEDVDNPEEVRKTMLQVG